MQKWRTFYSSNLRVNEKKVCNDETGITLVELLAAISILSIVILLAGSVHMFGQKQFIEQTKSASQANDLSYAMTVMSKDLRKKEATKIDVNSSGIIEKDDKGKETEIYTIKNNQLKKGEEVLANNVKESSKDHTAFTKEGDKIVIKLETIAGVRPKKTYETTIYFRR